MSLKIGGPLSVRFRIMDPSEVGLTAEDIEVIVKCYIQDKRNRVNGKFRLVSHHVKRLSEEPVGYLGEHYLLNVNLREKMVHYSPEEEEEYAEEEYISFFMKVLPVAVPKLAEYIEEMGCFKKEIQLYKHVIPRLQDVMIGTRPFAPTAYFTKGEQIIVFENLKTDGYSIVENTRNLLDFEHLKVALQALAKLHASSLILEERTRVPMTKLYSGYLNENAYIDDDDYVRKVNLENAIKVLCEFIKRIEKYRDSGRLTEILEKFPEVIRKIYDFAKPSLEFRNVFNHGDLWSNNVMFRYAPYSRASSLIEEGTRLKPIEARFVDFQLSRYAPPVLDVHTLITLCTVSAFRKRHWQDLLDLYYDELVATLAGNGCNPGEILPRTEFDRSCAHYRLAGLIETALFSHLTLIPKDQAKGLLESSESFESFLRGNTKERLCVYAFTQDATYRNRLSDMVSQIVDDYILI